MIFNSFSFSIFSTIEEQMGYYLSNKSKDFRILSKNERGGNGLDKNSDHQSISNIEEDIYWVKTS